MGEDAIFTGDFEQARRQYQDALAAAPDDETAPLHRLAWAAPFTSSTIRRHQPVEFDHPEYPQSKNLTKPGFTCRVL
jgi:hypothetical protein